MTPPLTGGGQVPAAARFDCDLARLRRRASGWVRAIFAPSEPGCQDRDNRYEGSRTHPYTDEA